MKSISRLKLCVISGCGAVAALTGCSGPQALVGPLRAIPQSAQTLRHLGPQTSWMAQKATSQNLLYIGDNGSGGVLVYSYAPGYKLVGFLAAPRYPGGECVDKAQDVFIPDAGGGGDVTFEYAHGGTAPIAILGDLGGGPVACSIDPTTGNLAVTIRDPHSDSSKLAV